MISQKLKTDYTTAYDWLQLVLDISIDYDGYRSAKDLMELIDEMREYVGEAIRCMELQH